MYTCVCVRNGAYSPKYDRVQFKVSVTLSVEYIIIHAKVLPIIIVFHTIRSFVYLKLFNKINWIGNLTGWAT